MCAYPTPSGRYCHGATAPSWQDNMSPFRRRCETRRREKEICRMWAECGENQRRLLADSVVSPMIWSIRHVSLFFPQRGQDAVQQAESRPTMEGRGTENRIDRRDRL